MGDQEAPGVGPSHEDTGFESQTDCESSLSPQQAPVHLTDDEPDDGAKGLQ